MSRHAPTCADGTAGELHARTPLILLFFSFFFTFSPFFRAYAISSHAVAPRSRAIRTVRDDSRDASGRALAFRGLRALKLAAGLRRTFPFFRLFGDRRRRCNTGTGSAALKSPDYIRAERRGRTAYRAPRRAAHACTSTRWH